MRYLNGKEQAEARKWMTYAQKEAEKSPCTKSKRGVVIISQPGGLIIGKGFNRPPGDFKCEQSICRKFCSDYTVHAEMVAMYDTLTSKIYGLKDATLYHAKIKYGVVMPVSKPSCVDCSKHIYDWGIKAVVLLLPEGLVFYDSKEFHELSLKSLEEKMKNG
jgi:deoxycytidylate deaminase